MNYYFVGIAFAFAVAISLTATNVYAEQQIQDRIIVLSTTQTPIIEFRDQGSKAFHFEIPDGSKRLDIFDAQAGLVRVTVANWGGVGIGTTAPQELLHVVGNIKTTGDLKIDGDIIPTGDLCIGTCP